VLILLTWKHSTQNQARKIVKRKAIQDFKMMCWFTLGSNSNREFASRKTCRSLLSKMSLTFLFTFFPLPREDFKATEDDFSSIGKGLL